MAMDKASGGSSQTLGDAGAALESFGRVFFDGGQTVNKKARQGDLDVAGGIMNELLARARGTDQYMALVDDLFRRSAEEFAPTKAGESSTGGYSSTSLRLLQDDARARAISMAQAAILQAQQASFSEASRISTELVNANSTTEMKTKAPLGFITRPVAKIGSSLGDAAGTVICTELNKQGLYPEGLLQSSYRWSKRNLSQATWRGYHLWGIPVSKKMQKSKLLTLVFAKIAISRAHYLHGDGSVLGLLVHITATPLCWLLGTILNWYDQGRDLKPTVNS